MPDRDEHRVQVAIGAELCRARIALDTITLRVDLHRLLKSRRTDWKLREWATAALATRPDGVVDMPPSEVSYLASVVGCTHPDLAKYLARFMPHEA